MNIYFTVSFRGALQNPDGMRKLISHLEKQGHKVQKRLFKISSDELDAEQKTISDIISFKNAELPDIYKATLRKIREADLIIADTTVPSSGAGYEIAIAQTEKKPILVLHNEGSIDYLADVVGGNTSKVLQLIKYSDIEKSLPEIDKFIKSAKELIDTKFILIIPTEIDRYLEWSASENRMHKAQIVRGAIENIIDKDKEYSAFLREQEKMD